MEINKASYLNFATRRYPPRPGLLFAFLLTGVLLSACATPPQSTGNFVAERAQDRWDALLAGELEAAYAFYSPGYRSTTSLIDFAFGIRARRVHWTSAQYTEHRCSESSCTVTFDVGFRVNQPVPGLDKWDGSQIMEEKWVRTDGQWWYLPKK